MDFNDLINRLKEKDIVFESGLTEEEFNYIETLYDIKFPPDLKEFLSVALPVSKKFVNWRDYSDINVMNIRHRINWPLDGMIYDIENNAFWYEKWGVKPDSIKVAVQICKKKYASVPQMVPIYSHRYIPSEPFEKNNPVFSIYQTDIICYGKNLKSYLQLEFHIKKREDMKLNEIEEIRFWSDFLE